MLRKKYQIFEQCRKIFRQLKPPQIVVISFICVILIGSFLLMLPFSNAESVRPASYIDCLFTSVSATCVTGLVTVTTASQWSVFGQIVILILIQIGGLSFVTIFNVFMVYIGKKITVRNRMNIQESMNYNGISGIVRTVIFAIKTTFLTEGIGAVFLTIFFLKNGHYSFLKSLYYGVFHAVSAFCNAGFDLLGETSFQAYAKFPLLNFTVALLIIAGGIGFSVWANIYSMAKKTNKKTFLTLNSKLSILTTLILLFSGMLYFLITEYSNTGTIGNFSFPQKIMASFFQSTTLRTAGYYTIPQGALSESSKFVSSILMLIGGSPGGTAGGIKTVTMAVVICAAWSTLHGKTEVDIFKRSIPHKLIFRAMTVVLVMLLLWFSFATLLEFTEKHSLFPFTFMDLLFEVSSALGTVGLTTGITPYLSNGGKTIIMISMFIGRLGPIGIAISLQRKANRNAEYEIHFPPEDVIIG